MRLSRMMKPQREQNRRGFSLTEMMIVILVIGIMATISAPPMFRYIQSSRLQTDTDRMAADLGYARSLAVSTGEILRFQATPAGYTLFDATSGDVIRQRNFDHGLTLDGNAIIDFFPWGMADAAVMNMTNVSGTKQISVLPTGIVEVD